MRTDLNSFLVLVEVVLEFFPEFILRDTVLDESLITELLVQSICPLEGNTVALRKLIVICFDEIVEDISLENHFNRNIGRVIVLTEFTIDLKTVVGDWPQFKFDLRHERLILLGIDPKPRWLDVDEPANNAGLGICDLHRPVGAHQ